MTPELTPDDPRLTALALGEITDPAERAALEARIAADPALREAFAATVAFAGDLRGALAREPLPFVDPAAIAARATGNSIARLERRRASGLGGSLAGSRNAVAPKRSRLAIFSGLAAAAACVALIVITTGPGGESPERVASAPASNVSDEIHVRATGAKPSADLGALAAAMPGLSDAGATFRPAGHGSLALGASNARAYAAAFSRELAAGRRPSAGRTRLDGLVNAFVGPRPALAGRGLVAVETALTDAPWNPEHRLLRVTVRVRGAEGEIVARNAVAGIDFDTAGVKSWRILGHEGASAAPSFAALRGGEAVTTLYEIEPAAASGVAPLAGVTVRYARADRTGAETAVASVVASDRRPLAATDADTRFAAGLAAYVMNLGDNPAGSLALAAGEDPDRRAFAALAR